MRKTLLLLPLIGASALAHDDQGAPALHLHGWDGAGLSALVAAGAIALWWLLRGCR